MKYVGALIKCAALALVAGTICWVGLPLVQAVWPSAPPAVGFWPGVCGCFCIVVGCAAIGKIARL